MHRSDRYFYLGAIQLLVGDNFPWVVLARYIYASNSCFHNSNSRYHVLRTGLSLQDTILQHPMALILAGTYLRKVIRKYLPKEKHYIQLLPVTVQFIFAEIFDSVISFSFVLPSSMLCSALASDLPKVFCCMGLDNILKIKSNFVNIY